MMNKTHYRKAFDSPYLSSADIVEPTVLTIQRVTLEKDKSKKTQDRFNTAYFAEKEIRPGEKLKPMVLNATNSKALAKMCDSPFIDDWCGSVTVYVDPNVKFGRETVEGLRIKAGSAYVTKEQAAELRELAESVEADVDKLFAWAGCKGFDNFPIAKANDARRMLQAKRK